MRVATLYDLHGNLRALEAVLQEIPAEATIVVGGDICAGGRTRRRRSGAYVRSASVCSGCAATPTAS